MDVSPQIATPSDRLSQCETLFQAVFHQSPAGMYLLDAQLRITDLNAVAESLLGPTSRTLGRPLAEVMIGLWSAEDAEHAITPFRRVLESGLNFKAHAYEITRRDTRERMIFDWEIRLVRGKRDSILGLLCTFTDVTRHVEAGRTAAAAQTQLSVLTSIVPQLIWSADAQGRMSYVNQRWIEYTGLSLEDCRTSDWRGLIHPEDYERVMRRWREAFAAGTEYQIEARYLSVQDWKYRWLLIRAWPQRDQDGRIVAWHGSNTDIDEVKQASEALRQAQERWQFMANSMPQMIFTATADGGIDYFNQQWMEYTGLPFDEIKQWGWTQVIHPEDLAENMRLWRQCLATGEPFLYEHRFRRADGSYRWHLSRAHAMRGPTGSITMWLGSNTDIEEQKRIQANLGRSNADLEQFASVASHDLKEPLRMVSGFLELIERRYQAQLDTAGRGFVRSAIDGAGRMHGLIDAIMSYSKVARPGQVVQSVDVDALLQETIGLLQGDILRKGAVVTCDRLPRVAVDPLQLGRVFQNLMANALKFSSPVRPEIHIRAIDSTDQVVIAMSDNGLGIPDDEQERVFEMFRRHHTQEDTPGTGIGLATCRKIIENHGGTIWLESQVGRGTTFFFSLPKSPVEASAIPEMRA